MAFGAFLRITRAAGVDRASAWGECLGRAVRSWSSKNRNIKRNLRLAFPDREDAWIETTTSAIWGQVGRNIAEYPHLQEIGREGPGRRIEIVDRADVASLRRHGRGVVFVAAHLGNWNIPAAIGNLHGFPLSVLYRRRKNTHVEAVIEHWRNRIRSGFINADVAASKAMIERLRKGECIGLYIDRRTPFDEDVPFFGIDAPTSTIPARLAIKTGAAYVPARVERLPDVRFRVTLCEPIEIKEADIDMRESARRMTSAANREIEAWVRERPEQWICTSNRWPRHVQPVETEGRQTNHAASAEAVAETRS
jgi:KDO2-lipid IV(A) lauroyltransferase